jgi:Protein of unknown function (DUF2844)
MIRRDLGVALTATLLLALATLASPARAALGGSADSVGADRAVMHGQLRSTPFIAYDQHQITIGSLVVNEYVTRAGQVFAITWKGPTPPDLRQLLGTYFPRMQTAADAEHRAHPGMHRQFALVQSDLVIVNTGRLRDFHGIAYLPALVPAGVSVSELQ